MATRTTRPCASSGGSTPCAAAEPSWRGRRTSPYSRADAGPIAKAGTDQIEVKEDDFTVTADLEGDVLFGPGSYELRSEADDALNRLLALTRSAHGDILIVGHTDVGGVSENDNETLSVNRGNAVANSLTDHGVDPSRITVEGHGSRDAIYPNPQTDEQHQANRRVVVTIEKGLVTTTISPTMGRGSPPRRRASRVRHREIVARPSGRCCGFLSPPSGRGRLATPASTRGSIVSTCRAALNAPRRCAACSTSEVNLE